MVKVKLFGLLRLDTGLKELEAVYPGGYDSGAGFRASVYTHNGKSTTRLATVDPHEGNGVHSYMSILKYNGYTLIQDQGTGLILRQHQLADGQAHRQVQLVLGPRGEIAHVPGDPGAGGLRRGMEAPVQDHAAVGAVGELVENLRRPLPQGRGKTALELGVGVSQGGHGQLDGGVFLFQHRNLLCEPLGLGPEG